MTDAVMAMPGGLTVEQELEWLKARKQLADLEHRLKLKEWRRRPESWLCNRQTCDGKPHDRWTARHCRKIPGRSQALPEGPWRIHYASGGRGSGKTRASAEGFAELILDNGPNEWAIVAPTFSDARDVCMAGPSGLIRALGGKAGGGGTLVETGPWIAPGGWNVSTGQLRLLDGSLIYCDGADDGALRIQGKDLAGCWCIARGELVRTMRGEIPIEDVVVGDMVLTRQGWRMVEAVACTHRDADIVTVCTADGHELRCTPDHEIWVEDVGWVPARALTVGARLHLWSSSPDRLHGTSGMVPAGTATRTATTRAGKGSSCMSWFGNGFTDRFRAAISFITAITTEATTSQRTWKPCPDPTISPNMGFWGRAIRLLSEPRSVWPRSLRGRTVSRGTTSAPTAVNHSSPSGSEPSSVAANAVSPSTVISVEASGTSDVYDLTVKDVHEFYASGVLVKNCDEIGLWKQWKTAWDESIKYAVRQSPAKRIVSGTPKANRSARELVKRLIDDPSVPVDRLRTEDNADNLDPDQLEDWLSAKGTRMGRQELEGELLTDREGALVTWDDIVPYRVNEDDLPPMRRVLISVDPSFSNTENSDECGIVAGGEGTGKWAGHGFILADWSGKMSMDQWAKKAVLLAWLLEANGIIYEGNLAGDVVKRQLLTAIADFVRSEEAWRDPEYASLGIDGKPSHWTPPRLIKATAKLPKEGRLEVVAPLWQQHRMHHVVLTDPIEGEIFQNELENQLTSWSAEDKYSPDRLDAASQLAAELNLHKVRRGAAPTGQLMQEARASSV
jgi:phage terminase large subunit-like protein